MPEILNLATLEKQNEILSNFPIDGFEPSKYKPLTLDIPFNMASPLYPIVNITGGGFIGYTSILTRCNLASGGSAKIIITLDGVKIVDITHTATDANLRGAEYEFSMFFGGTPLYGSNFPIVATGSGSTSTRRTTHAVNSPLFFNNSLKIEVLSTGSGPNFRFIGGVKS